MRLPITGADINAKSSTLERSICAEANFGDRPERFVKMKARMKNKQSVESVSRMLQEVDILALHIIHGTRRKWCCLDLYSATARVKIFLVKYLLCCYWEGVNGKKGRCWHVVSRFFHLTPLMDILVGNGANVGTVDDDGCISLHGVAPWILGVY